MRRLNVIYLVGLIFLLVSQVQAEEITVTTYYPAPVGVYKEMHVSERQAIGDVNGDGDITVGDLSTDPSSGNPVIGSLTVDERLGVGTNQPAETVHIAYAGAAGITDMTTLRLESIART